MKDMPAEQKLAKRAFRMQAVWLATAIIGALGIGISYLTLRKRAEQSRWAWWREFHERMRRYPTSEEVDDWISKQSGPTAP